MYQYQVSFGDAVKRAFSNYCCFTGRASRSEFWWFYLFGVIISVALTIVTSIFGVIGAKALVTVISVLTYLVSLAMLLPQLGLGFRRLHDTGRSGWNICWGLIPLVGAIILIVFWCQESAPAENKYGPVPNMTA